MLSAGKKVQGDCGPLYDSFPPTTSDGYRLPTASELPGFLLQPPEPTYPPSHNRFSTMSAAQLLNPKAESRVRTPTRIASLLPWNLGKLTKMQIAAGRSSEGQHQRWRGSARCPQVEPGPPGNDQDVRVAERNVLTVYARILLT